jgi:ankyrin repeat protein
MNLPPPPQDDDTTLAQFRPVHGQWELNDDNVKRIDPRTGETIFNNYCRYINTTPLAVYRYLIETKGCDVNAQDKHWNTPIHYALHNFNPSLGDTNLLPYLLAQKGVDVGIKNRYGHTLLHVACQRINILPLDVFELLIEKMGCDVNAQNKDKDTPIHNALHHVNLNDGGDVTVFIYLLNQKGVNVNIKGKYGSTLLHTACKNINRLPFDVFKALIETIGCGVTALDNDNNTPLHSALHIFNDVDNIAALTYLLRQKGVNGNLIGQFGHTLLHAACHNVNSLPIDIFKVLIQTLGCDVNVQDDNKNTPLHYALEKFVRCDDITVLHYLLNQKDVNVNIKNQLGHTLLHMACNNMKKSPIEIFKLLIEAHGADVNLQDNNKNTPIHLALMNFQTHDSIIGLSYLLSHNDLDIDMRGRDGNTLLHLACEKIDHLPLDIFKLLIEQNGANINAHNNNLETPLHRTLQSMKNPGNNTTLAYLLNQSSINFPLRTRLGFTLLHLPCDRYIMFRTWPWSMNAKDTLLAQIVEMIVEKSLRQILDETVQL